MRKLTVLLTAIISLLGFNLLAFEAPADLFDIGAGTKLIVLKDIKLETSQDEQIFIHKNRIVSSKSKEYTRKFYNSIMKGSYCRLSRIDEGNIELTQEQILKIAPDSESRDIEKNTITTKLTLRVDDIDTYSLACVDHFDPEAADSNYKYRVSMSVLSDNTSNVFKVKYPENDYLMDLPVGSFFLVTKDLLIPENSESLYINYNYIISSYNEPIEEYCMLVLKTSSPSERILREGKSFTVTGVDHMVRWGRKIDQIHVDHPAIDYFWCASFENRQPLTMTDFDNILGEYFITEKPEPVDL
jgi:hypothetical protein